MRRKEAKAKPGKSASEKVVSTALSIDLEIDRDRPFATQRFCLETRRRTNGIEDWEGLLNRDAWPLNETPCYLLGLIPIEFWPKSEWLDPSGFEVLMQGVLEHIHRSLVEAIAGERIRATEIDGARYVTPREIVAVAREWKEPLALFIAPEIHDTGKVTAKVRVERGRRKKYNTEQLKELHDALDTFEPPNGKSRKMIRDFAESEFAKERGYSEDEIRRMRKASETRKGAA